MTPSRREESVGLLLGALGVAIFSATLPLTRLAVGSLTPEFLTAGRAAIAGVLAIPVLAIGGRAPPWRDFPMLALAALCVVVGFPGFSALAMRTLPAAHASVVIGVLPLATAAVGALIDGDRPSPGFWGCAIVGSAIVAAFALREGGGVLQAEDALLLAAVASAALGYTLSAKLSRRMPAREVISWIVVLALPLSAPLAFLWRPEHAASVPLSAWACLAYLGAMSAYLGFFAWNAGLARGGVARVSQVQLAQPFLSLGLAFGLLGERIDAVTGLCAVAVVGLVFAGRRFRVGAAKRETGAAPPSAKTAPLAGTVSAT